MTPMRLSQCMKQDDLPGAAGVPPAYGTDKRAGRPRPQALLLLLALVALAGLARSSTPVTAAPGVVYTLVDTWRSLPRNVPVTPWLWPAGHVAGGVGVGASGDVAAVDVTAGTLRRYSATGALLAVLGGPGMATGQLDAPRDVVLLDDGRLAVSDSGNQRVQVWAPDGSFLRAWPVADPQGLAAIDGDLYVVSRTDRTLYGFDPATGRRTATLVLTGSVAPEGLTAFSYTLGMVERKGFMVADPAVGQVFSLAADGSGLRAFVGVDRVRAMLYAGGADGGTQPTLRFFAGAPEQGIVPIAWGPTQRGPLGPGSTLAYADVADLALLADGRLLAAVAPEGLVTLGNADVTFAQLADDVGRLVAPRRIAVGDEALIGDVRPRLQTWTLDGTAPRSFPATDYFASDAPADIAAAGTKGYVLDGDGTLVALQNGTFINRWEPADRLVSRPIAIAAQGSELALLDRLAQEVVIFNDRLLDTRRYRLSAGTYRGVSDVALARDQFFLVNPQTSRLEMWTRDGALVAEPYVASGPERVAALADGTAFVLASSGWIYVFDAAGEPLGVWRAGDASARPSDVATDGAGRVYVTDQRGEVRVYARDPSATADPPPLGGPGRCSAVRDKTAAPPVLWLGEEVTVQLEVDGACPAAQAPADIALVVDTSGSMLSDYKMSAAREAALGFVMRLDPVLARIGVISFNDAAATLQPLTGNKALLLDAVEGLSANAAGQTNMVEALRAARALLTGPAARQGVAKVIVFLTDGVHKPTAEATDPYPPELAAEIQAVHQANLLVFAVGLGGDVDRTTLGRMASGAEYLFLSPLPGDLRSVYVTIARRLEADLLFEEATVVDVVPGNMTYVPDSAEPPAVWDATARTLTWTFLDVLPPGFDMSYRLQPQQPGLWPTNVQADLTFTDAYGRPGALVFPIPQVRVLAPATPTPTPTPLLPTITPPPTPTPVPHWVVYLPLLLRENCDNDHLHLTLVLDASSSMTAPLGSGNETKLDAAKAAARAFLAGVDLSRDSVGLVQFNATARRLAHGTDRAVLTAAVDGITMAQGTRIDLGLTEGLADVRAARTRPGAHEVLILLSDGAPDPGTATDALTAAQAVRDDGITLYTVAVGADADRAFLRQAAGDATRAYFVSDGGELVRLYERLAATLVPCAVWGGRR